MEVRGTSLETVVTIQLRDDDDLDQDEGNGLNERWSDSEYMVEGRGCGIS